MSELKVKPFEQAMYTWDVATTSKWIASLKTNLKFQKYSELFSHHEIDGEALDSLTQQDIRRIGVDLVGHQKFILDQIDIQRRKNDFMFFDFSTSDHMWGSLTMKLIITMLYLVLAVFITSYTMVDVQYRVPEQATYPPLPDIVLDALPLIPFAFAFAEYILTCLSIILGVILLFHRNRLVVLRRVLCILATAFIMRSVTMFVTSLAVPGDHLDCQFYIEEPPFEEKLARAFDIAKGLGLSINGVRTCGDYFFSGHTVVLTVLNYSICQYSPDSWRGLHIFSWLLNVFGMFFVLAAHEHYTLDVIVAFYVASRLFLYYHEALRSEVALTSTTIFPLLNYLEEYQPAGHMNEFEWPWMPIARVVTFIKTVIQRKLWKKQVVELKPEPPLIRRGVSLDHHQILRRRSNSHDPIDSKKVSLNSHTRNNKEL